MYSNKLKTPLERRERIAQIDEEIKKVHADIKLLQQKWQLLDREKDHLEYSLIEFPDKNVPEPPIH